MHDVGTLRPTSGKRLGGALDGIDTPTLRGIWETAPYLHDGSAATLLDVIGDRNPDDRHGRTSALSETERAALVSYLLQIDNTALEDERDGDAAPGPGSAEAGSCGCRTPRSPRGSGVALLALLIVFGGRRRRGQRFRAPPDRHVVHVERGIRRRQRVGQVTDVPLAESVSSVTIPVSSWTSTPSW